MQNIAVPWVLYDVTKSGAWVGLGALLQFLPAMLAGPIGGVVADRSPRRTVLLGTQSVGMAAAFGLHFAVRGGNPRPGVVVILVAVAGASWGLGIPAWQSLVRDLVPRGTVLNAVTLNSAQYNASRAIGPAVGGVTLARFGPAAAFLINALSYLAVLVALAVLRCGRVTPRFDRTERMTTSFRRSLVYCRRQTGVILALVTVAVVAFLGHPVIQLTPVFAETVYEVDPGSYGLLTGALGTGAVLSAVLIGAYGDRLRRSRLVVGAITGYGVGVVAMGISPAYGAGLAAMFVIGAGYLAITSALNTSIQLAVDDDLRGRILALYAMAFTGMYPLGSLLQGWLSDAIGLRPTVAGAGVLLIGYAMWMSTRSDLLGRSCQTVCVNGVSTIPESRPVRLDGKGGYFCGDNEG
jgi:MFS family permease